MTHQRSSVPSHIAPEQIAARINPGLYSPSGQDDSSRVQRLPSSSGGIITPVTATTVATHSDSGNSFATPASNWSPTPNQDPQASFIDHHGYMSQPGSTSQRDILSGGLYPQNVSVTAYTNKNIPTATHSTFYSMGYTSVPFDPGNTAHVVTPAYPPSPHTSIGSERASSICAVAMTDDPLQTSPGLEQSVPSPGGSISHGQEPPRNGYNQIYCNHPDCARDPPIFTRKCEWT
jgi:hypothetical protein